MPRMTERDLQRLDRATGAIDALCELRDSVSLPPDVAKKVAALIALSCQRERDLRSVRAL